MAHKKSYEVRRKNKTQEVEVQPRPQIILDANPQTKNQRLYVDSIVKNILTLCTGPAGTGKTFLATIKAAQFLISCDYSKIILTRPIVECGEKIGFLPGEAFNKIHPYLLPILDVLEEVFGKEEVLKLIEAGIIEICPLGHMRGRTFKRSIIIADELQNAQLKQLKMLITRLGNDSKIVMNGDITQSDLGYSEHDSPLVTIIKKIRDVEDVGVIEMDNSDVLRSKFVQKIIGRLE